MSQTTVKSFADQIGISAAKLVKQLSAAGIDAKKAADEISDDEKMLLLSFLRDTHGAGEEKTEGKKITLKRKTTSQATQNTRGGSAKTVQVSVRKKRTYIKRSTIQEAAAKEAAELEAKEAAAKAAEAARLAEEEAARLAEKSKTAPEPEAKKSPAETTETPAKDQAKESPKKARTGTGTKAKTAAKEEAGKDKKPETKHEARARKAREAKEARESKGDGRLRISEIGRASCRERV